MIITFAGTIIAQESQDGGFDSVEGFLPSRKSELEWGEFICAQDAEPYGRMNRKRTLAGTISPGTYPDLATAKQAALLYLDDLPDEGGLLFLEGGRLTAFNSAVLTDLVVSQIGVSVSAKLTFAVGPGADVTDTAMRNKDGSLILNKDGSPITNK